MYDSSKLTKLLSSVADKIYKEVGPYKFEDFKNNNVNEDSIYLDPYILSNGCIYDG